MKRKSFKVLGLVLVSGIMLAAAIARHVGSSDWRLPIYHYDDYDNWEVFRIIRFWKAGETKLCR